SIPAVLKEDTVNSLVQDSKDTKLFFDSVNDYKAYFYYDQYGLWYFSYYDTQNYYNYIWGSLNDSDNTVINIQVKLYQEPKLSEAEVLSALSDSGIEKFKTMYPDTAIYFYYNGYDTWYVSGYSVTLVEAWFWAQVDDDSSEVIRYEENHPKTLPTMEIDEVLTLVHETSEFKEIKEKVSQYFEYYYFMNGEWYYYLQGTSEDGIYYWLNISVNDKSGEIDNVWKSSWKYADNNSTDPYYTKNDKDEVVTSASP
ncbi:MAG: hypothetical protein ACC656_06230, partial [Candidatus Heimdallarchaeota archaeon]